MSLLILNDWLRRVTRLRRWGVLRLRRWGVLRLRRVLRLLRRRLLRRRLLRRCNRRDIDCQGSLCLLDEAFGLALRPCCENLQDAGRAQDVASLACRGRVLLRQPCLDLRGVWATLWQRLRLSGLQVCHFRLECLDLSLRLAFARTMGITLPNYDVDALERGRKIYILLILAFLQMQDLPLEASDLLTILLRCTILVGNCQGRPTNTAVVARLLWHWRWLIPALLDLDSHASSGSSWSWTRSWTRRAVRTCLHLIDARWRWRRERRLLWRLTGHDLKKWCLSSWPFVRKRQYCRAKLLPGLHAEVCAGIVGQLFDGNGKRFWLRAIPVGWDIVAHIRRWICCQHHPKKQRSLVKKKFAHMRDPVTD